jgi:hypothetical protein
MKRSAVASVVFALAAAALTVAVGCRAREATPAVDSARAPQGTPTAPAPASAAPTADKLVGRWLRSDADYTIEIASVGPDGKLDARYFNPNPIRVSRAETAAQDGKRLMALELQDRGYPGNFYALVYDPGSDSLLGVYNHLGLNQQFEVSFSRISPKP